jgi:geranylgeranyl diphosphate synthase type II
MLTADFLQNKFKHELELIRFDGRPSELYDPISYTLNLGGKHLRPVMALLSCNMFGGDVNKAMPAAIGLEIFHNFTLIHDDIMDNAPLRRGKPTVFKKWNSNIAILSGDTMLAKAYEFLLNVDEVHLKKVMEVFTQTAIAVCEGQQFDMNFERHEDISIDDYLEMIKLKTAALTAASLKIGAIIGNAPEADAMHAFNFGRNFGIAFQLMDDLLDTYGEEEKFGKKIGGDIAENKKTFLYLKAREIARGETLSAIKYHFTNAASVDAASKFSTIKGIYDKLGIRELTENEIEKYYHRSLEDLDAIAIPDENKEQLRIMAGKLRRREV